MFALPRFLFLIITIGIANLAQVFSQSFDYEYSNKDDLSAYILDKYGLDPEVVNGKAYYNKYYRVLNHPYFNSKESHHGMLVLSGRRYEDVRINYNIYEQNLLLEFRGRQDGIYKIILSSVHTDEFTLDDLYFEKLLLQGNEPAFYQVISVDGISCFIHWSKEMLATTNNTQYADFFSDPLREYYLQYDNKISPFKNKNSFALHFPGIPRREIKKFMRDHGISFRDASKDQLEGLIKFVSSRTPDKTEK